MGTFKHNFRLIIWACPHSTKNKKKKKGLFSHRSVNVTHFLARTNKVVRGFTAEIEFFTVVYAELTGCMFVADTRLLGQRLFCLISGFELRQKS